MKGDRLVGGLWCHQVLARLSEYMDGELASSDRERIDAHLRVCDVCERFGGDFAYMLREIRSALKTPPAVDGELAERLRRAILEAD
jgi:predicted anti-sigma-YlaC factor YlaD